MSQTLFKGITLLEAIAANQPVEARRLSVLLDIPLPTMYRLISALEERGYVMRAPENGKYQLGVSFIQLGNIALRAFQLSDFIHPLLKEIAVRTGESASLMIRKGAQAICVDYAESDSTVRYSARVGQTRPLYAGAAGKVLLAYLGEEAIEKVISGLKLKKIGPNTIVDKNRLRERLKVIAQREYDVSSGELTEGVVAIAVPVFTAGRKIVGALTVNALKYRTKEKDVQKALKVLQEAAGKLSNRLPAQLLAMES